MVCASYIIYCGLLHFVGVCVCVCVCVCVYVQLKGYAQSQSANPAVGSSYMGVAVEGRKARIKYYVGNGEVIIAVAYIMPFAVALLVFLVIFIGCCCCCFPVEEAKKAIEHNHRLQANSVAAVLVCLTFCFYTFALDITAWARECQTDVLPSFYMKINHFINITLATSIIYGLIGGLLLFVFKIILCSDQPAQTGSNNTSSDQQSKFVKEIKMFIINYQTLFLFEFVIVGSAILSFTAHFPSILMAWATDPFYASRIALFYGFTIGAYFTAFHFTYILCCDVESQPLFKVEDGKFILSSSLSKCFCKLNGTADGVECRKKIICTLDDNKKPVIESTCWLDKVFRPVKSEIKLRTCLSWALIIVSLCFSFLFVSIIVVVLALFVVTVPVSNSIETASDGVRSIYSGAVILIGGLLAYKIGGEYIKKPFSISDALKKAMVGTKNDPFGQKKPRRLGGAVRRRTFDGRSDEDNRE